MRKKEIAPYLICDGPAGRALNGASLSCRHEAARERQAGESVALCNVEKIQAYKWAAFERAAARLHACTLPVEEGGMPFAAAGHMAYLGC